MPKTPKPTGGTTSYADRIQIPKRIGKRAVVVTYSELDTFRQCPLKHQWAYKERWSREPKTGSPLSRGSLWHEVLETHYEQIRRGETDLDTLRNFAAQNYLYDEAGRQDEDQELVSWMYDGYLEAYKTDPQWRMLAVEAAGQTKLPHPSGRYWLRFKIDLLVQDRQTKQIWLVDHKSASQFTRQTEIDIDDQFGLYTWALRKMGVPVFGFVRSDARTQRNKGPMTLDQRFRRVTTYRTDTELENIARDAALAAHRAWGGLQPEPFSSPAPDRCVWRCDFLQPHLMVRKGADPHTALRDFGFRQGENKHREYAPNPAVDRIATRKTP